MQCALGFDKQSHKQNNNIIRRAVHIKLQILNTNNRAILRLEKIQHYSYDSNYTSLAREVKIVCKRSNILSIYKAVNTPLLEEELPTHLYL